MSLRVVQGVGACTDVVLGAAHDFARVGQGLAALEFFDHVGIARGGQLPRLPLA